MNLQQQLTKLKTMKKRTLIPTLMLAMGMTASASPVDIDSIIGFGLPVVVVTTINGEEPTSENVDAPEGCFGQSIRNATKVPGRVVVISAAKDTLFDSGEYEKKKSGMTIKHRGNTSVVLTNKKPFKIKLQKKGDMLARGSKHADKDWALLNPHLRFNNVIATKILKMLGQPWVPEMQYVNLVFNGDYRGLYMLSETVERNTKCRVDVADDGYIIENDPYWWNEDKCFAAIIDTTHYKYTFKYPDTDDLTDSQLAYIKPAVEAMEQSIVDGTYDRTIDVGSFASWLLFHEIIDDWDAGGANRYLTKYDTTDSSKFHMGPAWDFDGAFINDISQWSALHNAYCFGYLLASGNKSFAKAYVGKWDSVKDTLFDRLHDYLAAYRESAEAKAVYRSWVKNELRWDATSTMTEGEITAYLDDAISWLERRKPMLDSLMATIDTTSAADAITTARQESNNSGRVGKTYNIMGQQVSPQTKGIVIRDGRKRLNK